MSDVFISYSRHNLDFVHKLDAALTAQGKVSWFDQKKEPLAGLPPGSKWWEEIKYGIETADNFLFIISPASISSPYCNAEIAYACQHEKRLVTVLYCGVEGEADTLRSIDQVIDTIPDNSELPPSVSATITNLRSLTRRNWLEIGEVQYVAFFDGHQFERALAQLIQGLDMDLAWIRLWSQVRQTARIWAETGDSSYLWSEMRLKPVREVIAKRTQPLTEIERDFIRPESERLLRELDDIGTPHARRSFIGEHLCKIGDPRAGVGLRPDGLPDIAWCEVPGGKIEIKEQIFTVQPFYIAKYPITYMQFQVFLDDPDGFACNEWWESLTEEYRRQSMKEQHFKFVNHPRENVSWYQSIAFCRWLNAKLPLEAWPDTAASDMSAATCGEPGRLRDSKQDTVKWEIRLPAEWEWQQAATGGDQANEYAWRTEWDGRRCNTKECGLSRTTAVGMYPDGASPIGALDMLGNVWEWCVNEHKETANTGTTGDAERILRGGAWNFEHIFAHCSAKNLYWAPRYGLEHFGFRVVCARLS